MNQIGKNAKRASITGNTLKEEKKNQVLKTLQSCLIKDKKLIFEANAKDIEHARNNNLSKPLIDRLILDDAGIDNIVAGLEDVINLDDLIGQVLESKTLDNGLDIEQVTVPLGVIGIIYESRPNVTVDAFALCFKVGNAVILKGGKEAIETNIVLEKLIRKSLKDNGVDENMIQLIKDTSRASTLELMKLNQYVDVLIPRGSAGLIQTVLRESTIPVIETGSGNCHIFVDKSANLDMALNIIENAKLQRLGVCNTVESLVVHKDIADTFIPLLMNHIPSVSVLGDAESLKVDPRLIEATPLDFYKEYLDTKMSLKIVDSVEDAILHINEHNTKHSDAIITEDERSAELFTHSVDSAAVYVNASTRFTDGYVFGLGAEIGISTQKLHARGPMGLKALTTYKYIIKGKGQIR